MIEITLDAKSVPWMFKAMAWVKGKKCKYCGEPITPESFGAVGKGIFCCQFIGCLLQFKEEMKV